MRPFVAPLLVALLVGGLVVSLRPGTPPPSPSPPPTPAPSGPWKALEPGLDVAAFKSPTPAIVGDSRIHVLRVDPARFELRLINASAGPEKKARSARTWARERGLVAAINAAMYHDDNLTSTHLMLTRGHVNNPRDATSAKAILAFDRKDNSVPPLQIIDRECEDFSSLRQHYHTLVQSIRMVSCKRANVWTQQPKQWSHAAIGADGQGRALFIFTRSPFSTHDLIDTLLALPIDLQRMQYSEGGPETQLYVKSGSTEIDLIGSYETGFFESDANAAAWPVPNVVGVVRRSR